MSRRRARNPQLTQLKMLITLACCVLCENTENHTPVSLSHEFGPESIAETYCGPHTRHRCSCSGARGWAWERGATTAFLRPRCLWPGHVPHGPVALSGHPPHRGSPGAACGAVPTTTASQRLTKGSNLEKRWAISLPVACR